MAAETPAAPLEKARTILHRVYLQLGSQAPAEYNEAVEALLAALDADKRLERAEDLLRSASRHLFRDAPMSMAIHDYFARREEKGENRESER